MSTTTHIIAALWVLAALALGITPDPDPCDRALSADRYHDGRDDAEERLVCEAIASEARANGLPVPLALAIVDHESRFHEDDTTGVIRGPWQVHTGYYCSGPVETCNLYAAGSRALLSALEDCRGDHECAVCEWLTGGECATEHEWAWMRSVLALSRRIGR